MNFLAHIYLSGDDEHIMIGNFIGDFVKGKAWEEFDERIQRGILLHRTIDQYTDEHEVVTKSKERLRPKYHHYAPVIADVFYDHFLSSLWNNYHSTPLLDYTHEFYRVVDKNKKHIPEKALYMFGYMKRDNWLYNYQFIEGIRRALTGMSQRTTFDSHMEEAADALKADYSSYKDEFEEFFPDLVNHVKTFLNS